MREFTSAKIGAIVSFFQSFDFFYLPLINENMVVLLNLYEILNYFLNQAFKLCGPMEGFSFG